MITYSPPAGVTDLKEDAKRGWSDYVIASLEEVMAVPQNKGHALYLPMADDDGDLKQVGWDAYPKTLTAWYSEQASADAAAESLTKMRVGFTRRRGKIEPVDIRYRQQDEYCEWRTTETRNCYVRRITFSSESADYWEYLAAKDLRTVHELYKHLVDNSITVKDLQWPHDVWVPSSAASHGFLKRLRKPSGWVKRWRKGDYNVWNDFNTCKGIVHSTHPDNTLQKAAMLLAGATVRRTDPHSGEITEANPLICASGFGDPNRMSDPSIGFFVNTLARGDREVSVGNPVGVYISGLRAGGFRGPRGEEIHDLFTCIRGVAEDGKILRAEFKVPDDLEYVALDGVPVTRGAQVARRVRITSQVLVRRRVGAAPAKQAPVARCVAHPDHPAYRGVFFDDMDWPMPPTVTRPPTISGTSRPNGDQDEEARRWDSEVLDKLAGGDLESRWSRWSRWSLFGRWS
jgi:hypothetical protein